MAALSGLVAILNEALDTVIEIRDLGPTPIRVKDGIVRPFTEIKPALGLNEFHKGFSDNIEANLVTRTWVKSVIDLNARDQAELNAALTAQGSVVRALGLITFEEINKLRQNAGLTQYTMQQFQTALLAKMRT